MQPPKHEYFRFSIDENLLSRHFGGIFYAECISLRD